LVVGLAVVLVVVPGLVVTAGSSVVPSLVVGTVLVPVLVLVLVVSPVVVVTGVVTVVVSVAPESVAPAVARPSSPQARGASAKIATSRRSIERDAITAPDGCRRRADDRRSMGLPPNMSTRPCSFTPRDVAHAPSGPLAT